MKIYDNPEAYVEILNDHWGMPDFSNEIEKHIEGVWGFWIVTWTYDKNEVAWLLNNVIETQWVITNQPKKRKKWKYTDYCDIENYYVYTWCTIC